MPKCVHCGREVAYDAEFCPGCGKKEPAEPLSVPHNRANAVFPVVLIIVGIYVLVTEAQKKDVDLGRLFESVGGAIALLTLWAWWELRK
jgi:hypothetical protein